MRLDLEEKLNKLNNYAQDDDEKEAVADWKDKAEKIDFWQNYATQEGSIEIAKMLKEKFDGARARLENEDDPVERAKLKATRDLCLELLTHYFARNFDKEMADLTKDVDDEIEKLNL